MKELFPDWHIAKLVLEGYAEDGVTGKLGYNSETGSWFADLDDAEYEQYLANLRRRHSVVLKDFGSIDWRDATNIQGSAIEPPRENENRLSLYLLDYNCNTTKGFKIKDSFTELMDRKGQFMYIGSTCSECGKKMLVVLTWEDVKPQKKDGENA